MNAVENWLSNLTPQEQKEVMRLFNDSMSMYKLLEVKHGSVEATKMVNKLISEFIEEGVIKSNEEGQKVSCVKGCSFCCNILVMISDIEAKIIAEYIKTPEQVAHLERQRGANTVEKFSKLPYAHRRCVFLENNTCSIYKDRPSPCIKHYTVTPPSDCDTEGGALGTQDLFVLKAELASCALAMAQGFGSLADMVLKHVKI